MYVIWKKLNEQQYIAAFKGNNCSKSKHKTLKLQSVILHQLLSFRCYTFQRERS